MMSATLSPGIAAIILFGSFFFFLLLRVTVAFALGLSCLPLLARQRCIPSDVSLF